MLHIITMDFFCSRCDRMNARSFGYFWNPTGARATNFFFLREGSHPASVKRDDLMRNGHKQIGATIKAHTDSEKIKPIDHLERAQYSHL
jgi:hypothetical protein